MIGRNLSAFLIGLAAWLAAAPAWAVVTMTLYAHPGYQVRGGWLLFPHAFVELKGTVDATGEVVDRRVGFTPLNPGPQLLLFSARGKVDEPEARYGTEARAYLSTPISDQVYADIVRRIDWWASAEGGTYNLHNRNCIHFAADIARMAGLRTGAENTRSPDRFMTETAALNPQAAIEPAAPVETPVADAA